MAHATAVETAQVGAEPHTMNPQGDIGREPEPYPVDESE